MGVGYFHDSPEAKLARTVDIYENRRPSQVTDFFSALSCIAMHNNKYLFFNNSLKYMREKIIIKKHDY